MKFKKNLFISFEGPEASGKSSQIKLLSKYLQKNKIPYLITREPGGSLIAEKLRKIILDKNEQITNDEEILLFMAARLNHLNNIIYPALKSGKIVISDRYADSTFVYQGYVNNYGMNKSINLHKLLLKNFLPNKTFLFLLSPEKINERLKKRKSPNKYDKLNLTFHKKVNQGYRKLSKNDKRFYLINASNTIEKIQKEIINVLKAIK
jgi:dTMP kinase